MVVVAGPAGQLVGEGRDGFRIDRRFVPFEKSGKVRLALVPPGATLPAVCVEEICRRSERVLRAVDQVAAIAVAVDVVLIAVVVGLLTRNIRETVGTTEAAALDELKEETA